MKHHFHITGNHRDSVHSGCNINVRSDSHLIMQEIDKSDSQINFITNGFKNEL